ncbi:MAG: hypothetical protein AAF990_10270 [Bacteroidota bacterium]
METKTLRTLFRTFLIIGCLFFFGKAGWAQPYPVTANLQMIGQTTPKLDASIVKQSNKVYYTLIMNDPSRKLYRARLRLTISGMGVTIRTSERYIPPAINLTYNVPVVLTGADLAEYFDIDNLDFTGLSKKEFYSLGRLPEGAYSVCVEAYDYFRANDPPISNKSCASTLLMEHDPPIIINPIGQQPNNNPMSMNLSWQAMHVGAFPVDYEIEIFESIKGMTEEQIVTRTAPVFSAITPLTSYLYTAKDPRLRAHVDYIFRVRVIDPLNEQTFANFGYSKLEHFQLVYCEVTGRRCDDRNECTINDVYDRACRCVGELLPDSDGDGVCDMLDKCPGGDDNVDTDDDGIPDDCDECVVGGPCDDGNPCTYNDRIGSRCNCYGIESGDNDKDGLCNAIDPCPEGPQSEDADNDNIADACDDCIEGTPCDDGDVNTTNDVLVWNSLYPPGEPTPSWVDACECRGTPGPCYGNDSDNDGVCDNEDKCEGFDDNIDSDFDGIPDGCDTYDNCTNAVLITAQPIDIYVPTCDYCLPIIRQPNQRFVLLTGIKVQLPDGSHRVLSGATEGFSFPYCSNTEEACFGGTSRMEYLTEELHRWLRNNNYEYSVAQFSYEPRYCRYTKNSIGSIELVNSEVRFIEAYWIGSDEVRTIGEFEPGGKCPGPGMKYKLTATLDSEKVCRIPTYQWSTGETTSAIYVEAPLSNYSVTVTCHDDCEYVSGTDIPCIAGDPCDDYDPCTIEESMSDDCFCSGTYVGDMDGDGACDALDICPGGNDYIDANNDNIPDACVTDCRFGERCDDGNPCTVNDQYDRECNCAGVFQDTDGDSVCDALDKCPGFPDYYDLDLDGIPDNCDTLECITATRCASRDLVKAYCACNNIKRIPLDTLSMYYFSIVTGASIADSLTVEETGDSLTNFEVESTGSLSEVLDFDQIAQWNGYTWVMMDQDGDGVCDLLDMCPGSNDLIDFNKNCIPDGCEFDCRQDYGLQLQVMFDRECDDGDDCTPNEQINCNCECEGIIDDSDGDGICDEDDPCQGGNDNHDADNDGIPNACDTTPCGSGGITPCDDGDDCTYGDYIGPNPDNPNECICLSGTPDIDTDGDGVCDSQDQCHGYDDAIDADVDGIPDSCDVCINTQYPGTVGMPCEDGLDCTILDEITFLYDEDGNQIGCDCIGIEVDSDDDGVCDALDQCPGWNDFDDYDDDDIPDGCDPPWYEIDCPIRIDVVADTAYGLILSFDADQVTVGDVPNPIDINMLYDGPAAGTYQGTMIPLTGYRELNGIVEAFYEVLDLDVNGVISSTNGHLTVSFSEHQSCTFVSKGRKGQFLNPVGIEDISAMPCPAGLQIKDGKLELKLASSGAGPINLNDIPQSFEVNLNVGPGTQVSGTANVTNMTGSTYTLFVETDFPISTTNAATGTITFPNGPDCEYNMGNIVTMPGCAYYLGQPCSDGDTLTHSDAYDVNCNCVGIVGHDLDGDGVHDDIDQCPGNPDTDSDGNGVPDLCECPVPSLASIQVINGNDVEVVIENNGEHTDYAVYYFPTGNAPGDTILTSMSPVVLPNVPADIEYTIEVEATCTSGHTSNRASGTIVVPFDPDAFYCGIEPPVDLSNVNPLPLLKVDDVITAGDFLVVISEVSGENGTFSGAGYIEVPYLNQIRLNVTFKDIYVNNDYIFVDGLIEVTGIGLALISEELANLLNDIVGGLEQVAGVLQTIEDALEALELIVGEMNSLEDYYNNGHNSLVNLQTILEQTPHLPDNVIQGLEDAIDCVVQSANDDDFLNCKQGLVDAIAALNEALAILYDATQQIVFRESTNQTYGFDTLRYGPHDAHYLEVQSIAGQHYSVAWKSVKSGGTDVVKPQLRGGGAVPANIHFEDINEAPISTNGNGEIPVTGKTHEYVEQIYAIETEPGNDTVHVAGQVAVVSYDEKPMNVVLVPVNPAVGTNVPYSGYNENTVIQAVKDIFSSAVVKVEFPQTAHPGVVVSGFDNVMNSATQNESVYTAEMTSIIDAFEDTNLAFDDVKYIFIVNEHEESQVVGEMPPGRQYGFVFRQNIINNVPASDHETLFIKTVAHELGHGAFSLQHTFSEFPELERASTFNLMDNALGTDLHKYQWDAIHQPAPDTRVFGDDEDSQNWVYNGPFKELKFGANSDNTFSFMTPTGHYIILPEDVTHVVTYYGFYGSSININYDKFINQVPGSLKSFKINGVEYNAEVTHDAVNNKYYFSGYKDNNGTYYAPPASNPNVDYNKAIFAGIFPNSFEFYEVSTSAGITTQPVTPEEMKTVLSYPAMNRLSGGEKISWSFENTGVVGSMFGDSQTMLNKEVIEIVFKNFQRGDGSALIRSKLLELATAYKFLFLKASDDYHFSSWSCVNFASVFNTSPGDFDQQFRADYCNCSTSMVSGITTCSTITTPPGRQALLEEFYNFFTVDFLPVEAQNNLDALQSLTVNDIQTKPFRDLAVLVNSASVNEINNHVSAKQILWLLSRFANINGGNPNETNSATSAEHAIVRLIKNAGETKADSIVLGIEGENLIQTDQFLFCQLLNGVNNTVLFIGTDQRKELVLAMVDLFSKSQTVADQRFADYVSNFEERTFILDYQNVLKRMAVEIGNNASPLIIAANALGNNVGYQAFSYHSVDHTCDNDGEEITLTQSDKSGFRVLSEGPTVPLRPFDVISFHNKSNLSTLRGVVPPNGNANRSLVPALVGAYGSLEGDSETTKQLIVTAIDVVTIATGAGALSAAMKVRKALILMDMASSGFSLAATALSDIQGHDNVTNALNTLSMITGALSLGAGAVDLATRSGRAADGALALTRPELKNTTLAMNNTEFPVVNRFQQLADAVLQVSHLNIQQFALQHMDHIDNLMLVMTKAYSDAKAAGNTTLAASLKAATRHVLDALEDLNNPWNYFLGKFNIPVPAFLTKINPLSDVLKARLQEIVAAAPGYQPLKTVLEGPLSGIEGLLTSINAMGNIPVKEAVLKHFHPNMAGTIDNWKAGGGVMSYDEVTGVFGLKATPTSAVVATAEIAGNQKFLRIANDGFDAAGTGTIRELGDPNLIIKDANGTVLTGKVDIVELPNGQIRFRQTQVNYSVRAAAMSTIPARANALIKHLDNDAALRAFFQGATPTELNQWLGLWDEAILAAGRIGDDISDVTGPLLQRYKQLKDAFTGAVDNSLYGMSKLTDSEVNHLVSLKTEINALGNKRVNLLEDLANVSSNANHISKHVTSLTANLITAFGKLSTVAARYDITWLNRADAWLTAGLDIVPTPSTPTRVRQSVDLIDGTVTIGRIFKDKLFSTRFLSGHSGTGIGSATNRCQVLTGAGQRRVVRDPDLSGFSQADKDLLLGGSQASPNPGAHAAHRHAPDVEDDALKLRAEEGYAPDGSRGGSNNNPSIPSASTKFKDVAAMEMALNHVRPGGVGTPFDVAKNAKLATDPNALSFPVTHDFGIEMGSGYFHPSISGSVPKGNLPLSGVIPTGPLTKIRAFYRRSTPTSNDWYLVTMYPE